MKPFSRNVELVSSECFLSPYVLALLLGDFKLALNKADTIPVITVQ